MSWLLLVASIVLEVLGTVSMKLSEGFSRPLYSALVAVFYAISIAGLALVLKRIDVSVAYAVWSGLGKAFIAMVGVRVFGEALSVVKVVAVILIVEGVVMLNMVSLMKNPSTPLPGLLQGLKTPAIAVFWP